MRQTQPRLWFENVSSSSVVSREWLREYYLSLAPNHFGVSSTLVRFPQVRESVSEFIGTTSSWIYLLGGPLATVLWFLIFVAASESLELPRFLWGPTDAPNRGLPIVCWAIMGRLRRRCRIPNDSRFVDLIVSQLGARLYSGLPMRFAILLRIAS